MKDIRIGNDISVRWSLYRGDEAYDLTNLPVTLYLKNAYGKKKVENYAVNGNQISWTFYGKDQKNTGKYSMVLVVREGEQGMASTDYCDFVQLVSCACQVSGADDENVQTEVVELSSEVDFPAIFVDTELDTESTNAIANKAVAERFEEQQQEIENSRYDDTEIKSQLTELSQEKEDKTNKVTSLTEESTDVQYPSAKAVYALSERIKENEILIEDLQNTKIDKEADDYYPQLAVGLADNLAGVDVVDSEVNFRRSGGGAISDGVARIEAIKGNSVVWNQLYKPLASVIGTRVINGVTFSVYEDGTIEANGTAEGGSGYIILMQYTNFLASHKYILIAVGAPVGKWYNQGFYFTGISGLSTSSMIGAEGYKIFQPSADGEGGLNLTCWEGYSLSCKFRPIFCDLTQMFGAGYEPTTIEEFYARIPMGIDINAYNEGEVIHMDVQSIESQGVNQWDEEWEVGSIGDNSGDFISSSNTIRSKNYIKAIGGNEYYFGCFGNVVTWGRVHYYDAEKKWIGSIAKTLNGASFIPPLNCAYMKFRMADGYGATYNHDICINLSDASINGKYFPYIKRVEDLSIIRKYFPQGMKSAGTAHDEIYYDKTTNKKFKVQRIASVDLGTLNWVRQEVEAGKFNFYCDFNGFLYINSNTISNILTSRYIADTWATVYHVRADKIIASTNNYIRLVDNSFTDAVALKASLQGVMLYYELAEPIVTELDAKDQFKDLDYQVWNCGTEKAIAEGKSAPLAADITYGFNAIGKIKELESLVAALRAKVGI